MDRKIFLKAEFALLATLLIVGLFTTARAFAQAAQTTDPVVTAPPFGTFLQTMDGQKAKPPNAVIGLASLVAPLNYGSQAFIDYRFFKGERLWVKEEEAHRSFLAECQAHHGRIASNAQSQWAYSTYAAGGHGLVSNADFTAMPCVDAAGNPQAVLISLRKSDRYRRQNLAIYILTPASAQLALAAQRGRVAREEAFQADMKSRREAKAAEWTAWRKTIAIGSETNCGPIIAMRGPMIEIGVPAQLRGAGDPAQIWLKREQLYPAGALDYGGWRIRCEGL